MNSADYDRNMSEDKSKIKITEEEYQSRLLNCTGSAIKGAVLSSVAAAVGIPTVLWKINFLIPSNVETRLAVALLSTLPIGYFVANNIRIKGVKKVEDTYVY